MTSPDDARRKRLLWRACHRGVREMDLLFGGYVAANLETLDDAALNALERLIDVPDQEFLAWATGQTPVPPQHRSAALDAVLAFRP